MNAYQKINEMITTRLIERIEATGSLPWKKPWLSVSLMPKNLVSGYCGILLSTEKNQAAYLEGWLKRLKADPSMLIKAGCQAQKAFDYILNAEAVEQVQVEAKAA